jgi:hypothetical protein
MKAKAERRQLQMNTDALIVVKDLNVLPCIVEWRSSFTLLRNVAHHAMPGKQATQDQI